jgi:RNA polymerase sigma factor (sigma-70 family)
MYTNTDPMLPQAIKLSALAGWLWEQSTARRVFDSLTSPAFITLCNR